MSIHKKVPHLWISHPIFNRGEGLYHTISRVMNGKTRTGEKCDEKSRSRKSWMLYYVTAFGKDIKCGWSLKIKIELCNTMVDSARLVAPYYGVCFVGRQSMIL